jgi:hypothetical protein
VGEDAGEGVGVGVIRLVHGPIKVVKV